MILKKLTTDRYVMKILGDILQCIWGKRSKKKKIRKFLPSQIFLNNEKFVVQIENFFGKWNL